ncbi:MAG: response regulator [Sphingomonas phyllosphaerae]|uniref:response regulator n=1 Tax=Sphingomonas phyllosphaerae TaxID=257003 RepID=UPI002FFB02F4
MRDRLAVARRRTTILTETINLTGRRLLIVEDEYFIASDLKRALEAQGVVVVGPVGRVADALALIEREQIDAATLDVNLGTAMCYPIAEQLTKRGVPFLFLTGYDGWTMPEWLRDVPLLIKPFDSAAVIAAVRSLCGLERV